MAARYCESCGTNLSPKHVSRSVGIKVAAIIALAIIVSAAGCTDPLAGKKQAIVNDVLPLVNKSKSITGDPQYPINGQCLIWDVANNKQSDAQDKLPSELKMSESSNNVTVFLITGTRDVPTGSYSISGEKAYEKVVDIAVAYWPEKVAVGMGHVRASNVPQERVVQHAPEYSDPNQAIADWVKVLSHPTTNAKNDTNILNATEIGQSNSAITITAISAPAYSSDKNSVKVNVTVKNRGAGPAIATYLVFKDLPTAMSVDNGGAFDIASNSTAVFSVQITTGNYNLTVYAASGNLKSETRTIPIQI
jgi:hypothetical protein